MKKRFSYKRIRGFSLSILGIGGGLSWAPPADERDIIRRLISFLEDRRVLYAPFILEEIWQVTESVLAMREELTKALQDLPEESPARAAIRDLRSACRKYLETPHQKIDVMPRRRGWDDHDLSPGFFVALGELRALFGVQVSALAKAYEIDVEEDLASIFPPEEST